MKLKLKRADDSFAGIIQRILEEAPGYQAKTQNAPLEEGAGLSVLKALPPNCEHEQKHVLIIKKDEEPVGVIDLIIGYPAERTAFLGLLLLKERFQGMGLGRETFNQLEAYLSILPKDIRKIRLAYVKNNPVGKFWKNLGFSETGETKPFRGSNLVSLSVLMEKDFKSNSERTGKSKPKVKTRRMSLDDASAVAEIHTRSWQHAYKGIMAQTFLDAIDIEKREKGWAKGIEEYPDLIRIVALAQERLVGFVCGFLNRDRLNPNIEGELYAIYVDPNEMNQGIGSVLFKRFKEEILNRGLRSFNVWVLAENRNARVFYEKMGGSLAPGRKNIKIGGEDLTEVCYEYFL